MCARTGCVSVGFCLRASARANMRACLYSNKLTLMRCVFVVRGTFDHLSAVQGVVVMANKAKRPETTDTFNLQPTTAGGDLTTGLEAELSAAVRKKAELEGQVFEFGRTEKRNNSLDKFVALITKVCLLVTCCRASQISNAYVLAVLGSTMSLLSINATNVWAFSIGRQEGYNRLLRNHKTALP